ncbi:MAG: type VII toxin-antitoxin system MntA family adenylyltransferase antitoxin [Planctomycetota bacterium]
MEQRKLEKLVEPVFRRHGQVIVAYLFGSRARGEARPGSDVDFAVLFERPSLDAYRTLWSDLHGVLSPLAFDLVELNGADPVLSFDVIREGKPVFFRTAEELNEFERRAWHRYQDTRQLRAIGDLYLEERGRGWSSSKSPSAND